MARKTTHVVPKPSGGWNVKKGGASRASKSFNNKQEATDYARGMSRSAKSELIIHRKDGSIQRTASYGGDPHPPKDRDTNP